MGHVEPILFWIGPDPESWICIVESKKNCHFIVYLLWFSMSGHGEGKAVKYLKIQLKFQNVWHLSHFPKLSSGPNMSFWLTTSGPQALCLPSPGIKLLFFSSLVLSAAIHVSTVPRWPKALPPYAKSASREHPRVTASPSKQPGPHPTSRYWRP